MSGNEKADLNSTAIFAQRRTTMGQELPVSDLWREAGPLRQRTFLRGRLVLEINPNEPLLKIRNPVFQQTCQYMYLL